MDHVEQAAGEKRVRAVLIEPLLRRGLAKPGGLPKDQFAAMQADLCAKLAYMSDLNLAALEEEAAGMAGGKEKDRFPVGNKILERAGQIQPPGDDASPLIRAVFAAQLGLDALAGGWAPELLTELRQTRRWPGSYAVQKIREKADDPVRQLRSFETRLAQGDVLTPPEDHWRTRRRALIAKCQAIADRRQGGAA
ncbi:hypothetical protein [Pseudorhodobacter sp.]|uniref:hypothetical protein n=1 Tax=Pseudorhodobacter sp. TaxID=1934400 RepID=UPI0026476F57|nr:hypothetical protein [Pseudorhodobacter sp.]MDN5789067.1 hypothetical protein [Pseudorhodobacter sp.]